MPMKKLIIIVTAVIFLVSNLCKAQDLFAKRSSTIRGFISAVFKDRKDVRYIMDNYMQVAANDTIPKANKEKIISAMVENLVQTSGKAFASSGYKICTYNSFKGNKKKFNTDDYNDIVILTIENEPVTYLEFKEDRIVSFYYIDKGALSFFVTI